MITYSNPRTYARFDDWPFGRLHTTCVFKIDGDNPSKGERVKRITQNPKTGRWCKPKLSTYSTRCRIVDGDDGQTYILHYSGNYGMITVQQSNLKYHEETIHSRDRERYDNLLALINQIV